MASADRLIEIFNEAKVLATSAERERFLAEVCRDDAELKEHVRALLQAHEGAGDFLKPTLLSPTALVTEKPGDVIGRYKLRETLGEGGCGVVYVAEQEEPVRRRVALKVIKLGMDTREVIARFEAERQALAMMDHPNIAKVLDAGTTETGRPYFVMELVRGVRITDYCDQAKLSTRERLDLFIKVCQAIQHAHQKGIIHRDIKPSNILVTLHDGVPVPKVIDFGIAKATEGRLTDATVYTQLHQFIGTPAYMSPEQAEMSGLDIDTRGDIYSLGVLLYELLAGSTPFDAQELISQGLDAMRKTIREKEPLRPSTKLSQSLVAADVRKLKSPDSAKPATGEEVRASSRRLLQIKETIHQLKGDLDWIVMKCLEKDRTRRYETANGLAADLQRHLGNVPVIARPPNAAYKLQKAWHRNKFVFSAGAAVVVALLVGIVVALWQAEAAKSAARELEANLYLTRLAAAHHELTAEPPNILQAESLLEACKPEMRDWEWRYLKRLRLVDPLLLHDPGKDGVNSLSLSTDGYFVASAGADGNVRIWDIRTTPLPEAPVQTLPAHPGFAFCVAFHPTDPTRLVSAGSDKRVKLWDLNTATVIASWPCGFSFEWLSYAVAFSPDGQRLGFSSEAGSVTIYSSASFQRIQTLSFVPPRPVGSLAFSPDGRHLATGHSGGLARVWDIESGRCLKILGRVGPPISCVAFSRNGQLLAGASFDHSVQVWSMANLNQAPVRFEAHTDLVVGLAFGAGNRLATAGHDRTVKIWDPSTGQQVLTFRSFTKETCVAFSSDGNRLAASSMDGTIQLWDATPLAGADDKSRYTLPHQLPISAMDISQDGSRLASGVGVSEAPGKTDQIFIWDPATGQQLQSLPGPAVIVFSLALSPDGRFLASVGDDKDPPPGVHRVKILDLKTGQAAFDTDPFPGFGVLFCVAYSPDGRRLVAAGQDKQLKVWDAATGRKIGMMGEHDRNVFNLAFSPDGRYLASAGKDGTVRVWDGKRLDEHQSHLREIGAAGGEIADTMAFSADSTRLAVGSSDLTAAIWDVQAGTRVLRLPHTPGHGFRALAFSPDGRWLASGGTDCTVKVWDAGTGTLLHTFRGHQGNVTRLKFVPLREGLHLASGSSDRTVKLWPLTPLEGR